jgi:SAM-dependent methyltransferase
MIDQLGGRTAEERDLPALMTAPARSEAGNAWAQCYGRRGVWWGSPEELTVERLRDWARQDWLADIVRAAGVVPRPGVRVLEAGCGTGQYGLALALQGFDVAALDYNWAALERARELEASVRGACHPPALFLADLMRLPTAADAYDLVFNQQVLEYFVDEAERRAAVAEMVRVTRPGGAVVIVVARPDHPFARLWRRAGWPGFVDQPDMADLSARTLEEELRQAGLVDVVSNGIAAWRALFFWPRWYERWSSTRRAIGVLTRWLDRVPLPRPLRRWMGLQLLVVGTKPGHDTAARATSSGDAQ